MEIKQVNNRPVVDYMARDYESLLNSMREIAPQIMPEWTEFEKESDLGNVLLQLFSHMGDILSYYQDRAVNEAFLSTAVERKSIIEHLRLIGYRLSTASPASVALMIKFPADCNDIVKLRRGDAFSTVSNRDAPSLRFEFTGDETEINCADLLVETEGDEELKNFPIEVEEGKLIREDVLGISTGAARQRFKLSHRQLILRSLGPIATTARSDIALWLELGEEPPEPWQYQDSLAFSLEGAKDFTIEIDEFDQATVIFGGEGFAATPRSGASIKCRYRVGGGLKGNVTAGAISTISDAPSLTALAARVTNPGPASGGDDRESIAHAVDHAPGVFRSLRRAITAEDYKNLALEFNGVGKVRAEATSWNEVTLFVAPQGGGQVSDVLREGLLAYFEDKRPLSTIITIADVDYIKIYLEIRIGIEGYFSENRVIKKVQDAVAALLSFDGNDFKETLYLSKFYEAIESVDGLRFVVVDSFSRQTHPGESAAEKSEREQDGRIQLNANELPRIPGTFPGDPTSDEAFINGLKLIVEKDEV